MKQQDGETLQAWLKRFTKATVEVGPLPDDALLLAVNSAFREDTTFAFSKNLPLLIVQVLISRFIATPLSEVWILSLVQIPHQQGV